MNISLTIEDMPDVGASLVVTLRGSDDDGREFFMAMDYLPLSKILERMMPKSATLDENISPQTWPDNLLQNPEN